MNLNVLVHEGKSCIFLLGCDSFYDRLIFDRGMYLAFAEDKYPHIPIQYEMSRQTVKAVERYRVAPRSSALIQVQVTNNPQFTGRDVIITSMNEQECSNTDCCAFDSSTPDNLPVRNTVSVIDSLGKSFVLVENDTDDILTILPDIDIARVEFITDDESTLTNEDINLISYRLDEEKLTENQKKKWPISALKNELSDKLPSNVIVRWDNIRNQLTDEIPDAHNSLYSFSRWTSLIIEHKTCKSIAAELITNPNIQ